FSIVSGCSYEVVTNKDTSLVLVGANDPAGLVVLNENPGLSDKNWVSIPYNAAYAAVSDITAEYSAAGDPLTGLTNLRDDQLYESWLYNPIFGWTGTDFSIMPGRGYELVVISDTTWNPTEYPNEAKQLLAKQTKDKDVKVFCGRLTEPARAPVWVLRDEHRESDAGLSGRKDKDQGLAVDKPTSEPSDNKNIFPVTDVGLYKPVSRHKLTDVSKAKSSRSACALHADREVGISHLVFVHLVPDKLENIVFTAYRLNNPADVLTEQIIGCGVVKKDNQTGIWFNTGNFKKPWQDEEEVILIIEATKKGKAYFNVVSFQLDKDMDIQNLGEVLLIPIPDVRANASLVSWQAIDNDHIVGYSLYQDDKRLNEKVINGNDYTAAGEVHLRPVIKGGYETVYANSEEQVQQGSINKHIPLAFCLGVYPSPFTRRTQISYALPKASAVDVVVYDVTGKRVKTLISARLDPGYYKTAWQGDDEIGRKVAAGVYFILMNTSDFASQRKVIFVH
ncbi:MAG: T9SS type A sorting domain-containing protein, partial [bacterium]